MKLKISIALLLALVPAFAQAKPRSGSAHMRPQLFHDRAPKARVRDSRVRQARGSTSKTPLVVQQKEDF